MKHYLTLLVFLIMGGCVEKFVIPDTIIEESSGGFLAGDTTYLLLNPVWDESYDLVNPVEISIAQDGRVFVADSGQKSIIVFDQNGNKPSGFDGLKDLHYASQLLSPIDVDVDQKMNVFFIDGSQRIFIWNYFWNLSGLSHISSSGTFVHLATGATEDWDASSLQWEERLNDNEWVLADISFSQDQSRIDSILNPHIFYDGQSHMNKEKDTFYLGDSSKLSAITAPATDENYIYATDHYGGFNNYQQRVMRVDFRKSDVIITNDGDTLWAFKGIFGATIKGQGTGGGTVNDPQSIDIDYLGNIYYSQLGDYFSIHKIIPNYSGDYATYTSGFQPTWEIMQNSYFNNPMDVAVDRDLKIYVANTLAQEVLIFNPNGDYFLKAGVDISIVDTTVNMWSIVDTLAIDTTITLNDSVTVDTVFYEAIYDSVSVDTFFKKEEKGLLLKPTAVTVDKRGVIYVCDPNSSSVFRFRLSNTLDEDLQPNE
ncbi:MAG: hypothetical protein ISR83_00775 [Candidatus Marinimicrobia bacterium]|nr:hypothetical protein [Candidatus Neomarinimicrobiota bacterium]